jgi:hypothetical protein
VDATLDLVNPRTARSNSLTRRESRHSMTEISGPDSARKGNKKFRVFFPSDENIPPEGPAVDGSKPAKLGAGFQSFVANTTSVFKAPFIILLGDHTYQQYCIGFQIPVVFVDLERGFTIHTTYCLAFLTKFAFFSFVSYTIQQLDEELKLFSFKEPLPEYDPNLPLNPQLKQLNELMIKFNKILIPLYPLLILRNDYPGPHGGEKEDGVVNSNTNPTSKANNLTPPPPAPRPILSSEADYLAIIDDLTFSLNLKNTSFERKALLFRRTFYQKYYSAYLSNVDLQLDPSSIHYYEKEEMKKTGSAVGKNHALERDREDSFFILQWALPTLLKYLPLDQIILALGCAITEMKVIVKHKDLHVVSSCILALIQLLKPLKWCSPVIITLPDQLTDLLGNKMFFNRLFSR